MTRRRKKRGPGRPALGAEKRDVVVSVKYTRAEYRAIEQYVARENKRIDADRGIDVDPDARPTTVRSFIRDCSLDQLGLADFEPREGD